MGEAGTENTVNSAYSHLLISMPHYSFYQRKDAGTCNSSKYSFNMINDTPQTEPFLQGNNMAKCMSPHMPPSCNEYCHGLDLILRVWHVHRCGTNKHLSRRFVFLNFLKRSITNKAFVQSRVYLSSGYESLSSVLLRQQSVATNIC